MKDEVKTKTGKIEIIVRVKRKLSVDRSAEELRKKNMSITLAPIKKSPSKIPPKLLHRNLPQKHFPPPSVSSLNNSYLEGLAREKSIKKVAPTTEKVQDNANLDITSLKSSLILGHDDEINRNLQSLNEALSEVEERLRLLSDVM